MIHTIYTQDLIEITHRSNENIDTLTELLGDHIEEQKKTPSYIFALFCEMVWLNSSIIYLLRTDLENLQFKDAQQKEIFIPKKTLDSLTSLLLASYSAELELNKLSYSISLH